MPFSWRRPQSVEFPLSYLKFSALDSGGFENATYTVQDLSRDRYEEVVGIMKDKHLVDEPMYSSKGIREDPTSFNEMVSNWKNMLEQNISIVCYKENSDEIIAVNVLGVVTEKEFDAPHSYQGKGWSEVNNVKKFLKDNFFDPFTHYEVDKVMFAAGLYVDRKYKNRGIAVEMIKARGEVGKAVGVQVSSNVFSSLGAQKAAAKVGFEESFSIKYAELKNLTVDGDFPNITDEYLKIMSKKFY